MAACAYVHSSAPAFWTAGVADMPCLLLPRLLTRARLMAAHRQLYSAGGCWALGGWDSVAHGVAQFQPWHACCSLAS